MFGKETDMTTYQTINEERGARRAAELRRRFSTVSKASTAHGSTRLQLPGMSSRKQYLKSFLVWVAMAGVLVLFGTVLF